VVDVGGGLRLLDLPPRRAADRVITERIGVPGVARRLRQSELYRHFVGGCPGLGELALLETARQALGGEAGLFRCDLVVIDAPATGHGLGLLRAPGLVARAAVGGPIGAAAEGLADLLTDPGLTAVVCVTLAEEMSVTESIELRDGLAEDPRIGVEALVVNALMPPVGNRRARAALRQAEPAVDLRIHRRAAHQHQLARLDAEWQVERAELPLLAVQGPPLVDEIARQLEDQLPGGRRRERDR
jgi:anion-transporting  ArsA/GET3 family ATPase